MYKVRQPRPALNKRIIFNLIIQGTNLTGYSLPSNHSHQFRGWRTTRKKPLSHKTISYLPDQPPRALKMTSDSKQSVLITGCSKGGIGDALAQEFHSRGFLIFATARNLAKIQHLEDIGCEILALDVTNEKSVGAAVKYVSAKTGALHYLINNAGMCKNLPTYLRNSMMLL